MIFPRKIIFGPNAIDEFCEKEILSLGDKNVVVISSSQIHMKKLDKSILRTLRNHCNTLFISIVDGEPDVADVDNLYNRYKKQEVNIVIGIGGGSAMDLAKALVSCLSQRAGCEELLEGTLKSERDIRLILFPTTAGSGAEVTNISIIRSNGLKKAIIEDCLVSDLVVIDPVFIKELPFTIRLFTLIDATSHALEALWSRRSNSMTDFYALHALDIILSNSDVYLDPKNKSNSRLNNMLQIGAMHAGFAFTNAGVSLVHAFAYALAEQMPISHGQSVGIALLPVLEYFKKADHIFKLNQHQDIIDKIQLFINNYKNAIYSVNQNIGHKDKIIELVDKNKRLMNNMPTLVTKKELRRITNRIYEKISSYSI